MSTKSPNIGLLWATVTEHLGSRQSGDSDDNADSNNKDLAIPDKYTR